jgi:hypothetical protein
MVLVLVSFLLSPPPPIQVTVLMHELTGNVKKVMARERKEADKYSERAE